MVVRNIFKRVKPPGSRIIVLIDEEMIGDEKESFAGTIKDIRHDKHERPFLHILLDKNLPEDYYSTNELANEILVGGLSMNVVKELFGIRRRPRGLPVIVEVRSVSTIIPIEKLGERDKKTFISRGVVRLEKGKIPKDELEWY